jgi:hypothetical protein
MDLDSIPGHELPTSSRIIGRTRDVIVLDLPSAATKPRPTFTRCAIVLDPQADLRVFSVLAALHYQALKYRVNVIGLAKQRNSRLRWWYGDPATEQEARAPMQEAVRTALFPYDNWTAEPPTLVRMVDGVLDRDDLAINDLLRSVPDRYRLGLVTP